MINIRKMVVLPYYNTTKALGITNNDIDFIIVKRNILINDKSKDCADKESRIASIKHIFNYYIDALSLNFQNCPLLGNRELTKAIAFNLQKYVLINNNFFYKY